MISNPSFDNSLPSASAGPEPNLKGCNVCGQNHSTEACPFLGDLLPVQDTKTKTKARLTLPANLEVQNLADGSPTVVARSVFERGTQFGPFQAKRAATLELSIEFPLKIFSKDSDECYYLDTSDEDYCNWMCLVAPAASAKEQNLMCYQMKQDIYYTVMKTIQPGEQLKVWYAPYYAVKMGVDQPVKRKIDALTDHVYGTPRKEKKVVQNMLLNKEVTEKIVEKLAPQQLGARSESAKKKWRCRLCGEEVVKEGVGGGSGVATFAKHLMEHYKPRLGRSAAQQSWPCHFCLQNFSSEKELLHHKVKEHKVAIRRPRLLGLQGMKQESETHYAEAQKCGEAVSQNIEEGIEWQGEGAKTTSIVISRIPEGQDNPMLKDAGCVTISVKPDKPISGVELGPPYICDICSKEFHRAEYVYRHLRKHTGEFTCVSCMAVFARKESLQTHVCVGGVASNLYSCSYCPKVFTVPKLLKRHMSKHKSEFTCQICKHVYSSKTSLDTHHCVKHEKSSVRRTKKYNCSVCGKGFVNQNNLRNHYSQHHPDDEDLSYNCEFCEKSFLLSQPLEEHQSLCKQVKELQDGEKAMCPLCESVVEDLVAFRNHVRDHTHPFFCQHCGVRFRSRKMSVGHKCDLDRCLKCEVCQEDFPSHRALLTHHDQHGTATFHCFECSVSFFLNESFENHDCSGCQAARRGDYKGRKRKGKEMGGEELGQGDSSGVGSDASSKTNLICEVCGARYKTVYSLKAHVQLHGERRFECDICHKRFHRKDVLQEHISVHQDPQIPCPVCDKKVKTKKSLEVHMLLHKGERRYKCNECGKEFYQKGNLLKHMAVHEPTSKKSNPCPHCGKMFMSKDYLAVHLLEHTQGKVHQCSLCSKAFVKEHLLRTHHRQYHNNQLYACRYCGQSMRLRQSLRRHLAGRHPEMRAEWDTVGALDLMLVTRMMSDDARRAVEGITGASDTSAGAAPFVIQAGDAAVDMAESAEILLTVAAGGLHSGEAVMEASIVEDGDASLSITGTQGAGTSVVVSDDGSLSCLKAMTSAELLTQVTAVDEVPLSGPTFILEDGTIIQQDGTQHADILLCVLGGEIQTADLNLV
ncbi:zinc finger protein 26-like [Ischnura elegans]|uniref:zinc finger protein 26-like n=1 Tax=Ischnura elegans TaxID=197161 RepID=UPI001ED87DCE|nr:zinc finger protein 26-like [Ischnura elegans]